MGLHGKKSIDWLVQGPPPVVSGFAPNQRAKRIFDIVMATTGLILLSPVLFFASVAIKLDSRGPILARETMYGYGRGIQAFKLRSRQVCADPKRTTWHLTAVGRVLTQTGIDELPLLFNVLLGEMSIVGPRPRVSPQDLPAHCPGHSLPLLACLKPGIISRAHISGPPDEFRTQEQRIVDDLHYAANWSLISDARIVFTALFAEKSSGESRLRRIKARL
jgi:lipopolysaccharide/colanic/teichoic acid biosynthesis glycosyltransferase